MSASELLAAVTVWYWLLAAARWCADSWRLAARWDSCRLAARWDSWRLRRWWWAPPPGSCRLDPSPVISAACKKCKSYLKFQRKYFPAKPIEIRWIKKDSQPNRKKSCKASYYKQLSTNIKIKVIKVSLARNFIILGLKKLVLIL